MGQVVYLGLCLLGCLLFNPSVEGASNDTVEARYSCPYGALSYGGNCYELVRRNCPWEQAERECQMRRRGGHLVSIRDSVEERILSSYLQRRGVSRVWIGLRAAVVFWWIRFWEWSSRVPYNPGNLFWNGRRGPGTPIAGNCVAFSPSATPQWTQCACSISIEFVCKYKS